jgi:hypothetical protein
MAKREIDFLGAMRFVPRGANLPNRLSPSAFLYQPEKIAVFVRRAKS